LRAVRAVPEKLRAGGAVFPFRAVKRLASRLLWQWGCVDADRSDLSL
jgi:hypothetical protein